MSQINFKKLFGILFTAFIIIIVFLLLLISISQKAELSKSALEWNYNTSSNERWKWWCHGSPGIALTFLRLLEQTGEEIYASMASQALRTHPFSIRYSNLSQCHGLSGLREIYLEAYRILHDDEWLERAKHIALFMTHLRNRVTNNAMTWLVEDEFYPTADLMVGMGGILHFFLKLTFNEKIGFPLLLDPINT